MSAQPPPDRGGKRSLGGYSSEFAEDDGSASEAVREALAAAEAGEVGAYLSAVTELCTSRLLVPLMAAGDDTLHPDPARHAEMSAVLLQTEDGRRAMLAFTGVDALAAWNQRARPVPATLDVVADAAVQSQAGTVLVDFAGPHPLVIDGEILENLALGRRLLRLPNTNYGWLAPAPADDNADDHVSASAPTSSPSKAMPDNKEPH